MYDFSNLSPLDFEHLIADLMSAEMSLRFKYYKAGADGGIDTQAFDGSRRIVLQAKRYIESNFTKLKSKCKIEAALWEKRSSVPDEFWLATTVPLLPSQAEELAELFPLMPIDSSRVLGLGDIEGLLRSHPEVGRGHVKLWLGNTGTLERIIHSGVMENSDFERKEIEDTAKTYVSHKGFDIGLKTLIDHGSLVISGPPGIGKTTMAHMLALDHMRGGWEVVFVHEDFEAGDAVKAGAKRLIFFDDFLGQITLTPDSIRHSDHRINSLIRRAAKDPDLRFMMTSRDYILEDAHHQSERLSEDIFVGRKYVLRLNAYSKLQKAHILYNHLYASGLPQPILERVVSTGVYKQVVDHPNFTPRLIETMTTRYKSQPGPEIYIAEFLDLLDNPERQWSIPYDEHFKPSDQLLLISYSLYMSQRRSFPTRELLLENFLDLRNRLGFAIALPEARKEFRKALRRMDGGLIQISDGRIRSTNPGATEFLQGRLETDGHLIVYLADTNTEREIEAAMWSLQSRKRTSPEKETLNAILKAIERVSQNALSPDLAVVVAWVDRLLADDSISQHRSMPLIRRLTNATDDDWPMEPMETLLKWLTDYKKKFSLPVGFRAQFVSWLEVEALRIEPYIKEGEIELDEAEAFLNNVVCSEFSSPSLFKLGAGLTESAIDKATSNYTIESDEDASVIIQTITDLGAEYDLDVYSAIRDIEDTANQKWARDDWWEQRAMEERREEKFLGSGGIKTMVGESSVEASEEQIIDDMFGSLNGSAS
ncbi:restriction endonuclease [Hellea sp.]|nr:restriction endonuclease [Hellea sp.]